MTETSMVHASSTVALSVVGSRRTRMQLVMNPRQLWLIDASTAHVSGHNLGLPGPLAKQAALEDMRLPQRGLFAVASVRLERPGRGKAPAIRYGKPCNAKAII